MSHHTHSVQLGLYLILLSYILTEWCKVYCIEDGKVHTVSATSLEPEDCDTLQEIHLIKGETLLWKYKGKKYTTTLLEVYGNY